MKIRFENLTKRFGNFTAVSHFSAELLSGELICLLGPSGCGKSTILNMLSGIIPVSEGRIWFDDKDVTDLEPQDRGIGLVFQNYALYPHMTVLENIAFPLEIKQIPKKERVQRATEMAKMAHVESLLKRKPSQLSGGQQQRVAIARALVKKPQLLLLDEPLSNLDARLRIEMREEIRRIQQETKVTTIFVTHDQEEALSISDHIILMKDGILQQMAPPQDIYNEPANKFTADFLGIPPINNLPATVENGKLHIENSDIFCPLSGIEGLKDGRRVVLAIRAESFEVEEGEAEMMSGVISRVSILGKEELAYLRLGQNEARAYIDADHEFKVGQRVSIGLRRKGVFVFDGETGERLR